MSEYSSSTRTNGDIDASIASRAIGAGRMDGTHGPRDFGCVISRSDFNTFILLLHLPLSEVGHPDSGIELRRCSTWPASKAL